MYLIYFQYRSVCISYKYVSIYIYIYMFTALQFWNSESLRLVHVHSSLLSLVCRATRRSLRRLTFFNFFFPGNFEKVNRRDSRRLYTYVSDHCIAYRFIHVFYTYMYTSPALQFCLKKNALYCDIINCVPNIKYKNKISKRTLLRHNCV